jgi:PAS domain S-box-containing protein
VDEIEQMSRDELAAEVARLRGRVRELEHAAGGARADGALTERHAGQHEQGVRVLADLAPFPSYIVRKGDGRILYANQMMVDHLGIVGDPSVHSSVEFWDDPGERDAFRLRIEREGRVVRMERAYRKSNGEEFWAVSSSTLLRFAEEDAIFTVFFDVSERRRAENALSESEQRFRAIADATPCPIFIARKSDGRILYANEMLRRTIGFEDDPTNHLSLDMYWNARERAELLETLDSEGRRVGCELRHRNARGEMFWAVTSSVELEFDGEQAMLTSFFDVTDRKRAEHELAESQQLLHTTINALPHFVFVKDLDSRYILVNKAYSDFYETPAEDFANLTTMFTPHPCEEDKRFFMEEDRRVFEHGETVYRHDFLTVNQRGRSAYHDVIKLPLRGDDGEVRGLLTIAYDITDRKRAQDELRANERLLRTVVDTIPHLLSAKDVQGRFTLVNKAMAQACQLAPERFMGHSLRELPGLDPEHAALVGREDRAVLASGQATVFPARLHRHAGGEARYLQTTSAPLLDDDRRMTGLVSLVQDVHDRVLAEGELRQYQDSLEQLVSERTRALEEAQDELLRRERLAAVGQVTGTVAHELRNPLGTIMASFHVLKGEFSGPSPRLVRGLERIERNISRCTSIIDELLGYARVREPCLEPTRLDDWLVELVRDHGLSEGVSASTQLSSDSTLALDRERLRQAVSNVLDNACQSMREAHAMNGARRLEISSARRDGRVEIEVCDSGPGIPEEAREKVFEPLYSTRAFGVGLGLPLVKQVMLEHGGDVEIGTASLGGAKVVLWLPVPREPAALRRRA